MQQVPDPYRALGVPRGASEAEIKSAHRKLAKRYHPDASEGDTRRFLRVQEAYRLLTDPLRRREWDARHASGPVRATDPATPRSRPPARPARQPRPARRGSPAAEGPQHDAGAPGEATPGDERARRPRSNRAYTWSASEVPWWEEGVRDRRRAGSRPQRPEPAAEQPPDARRPEGVNEFDVYNRSSGAAWSMAARAYFRRGDQDLPRRGSFHREGTQPLTAARARAAAEAEVRRRAAAGRPPPRSTSTASGPAEQAQSAAGPGRARQRPNQSQPPATAPRPPGAPAPSFGAAGGGSAARSGSAAHPWTNAGVAHDPRRIVEVREQFLRRMANHWPSVTQRVIYALVAWLPVAALIGYGGSFATGCDRAALTCPAGLETVQALVIALSLGLLVALPRLAYVGALASLGMLAAGIIAVAAVAALRLRLPLPAEVTVLLVALMAAAYIVTGAAVIARAPHTRPWNAARRWQG